MPTLLFRPAGAGSVHNVLGMIHVNKVSTEETNGAFMAFEIMIPPGCGAPMHRHGVDAEFFFVLDGALTFVGPGGVRTANAGDACFLPACDEHAFRNDGDRPARALVISAPGRDAERFFGEIDAAMQSGDADFAKVTMIAARHHLTVLPPATAG